MAGRSVAEANQHLTPGVALTLSSESTRLPIGWYRVRATDGTHVTDTALVVVR